MSETAKKHKAEAPKKLSFAVIVCSSSRYAEIRSKGKAEDQSGDMIAQAINNYGHSVVLRKVVSDDRDMIKQSVKEALKLAEVDVIITCGGTGISPRDVTIEVVQPLLEKLLPGFGEALRKMSFEQIGSAATLTRAIAGISKGKVIFCIPGSPQGVYLSLEKLILPEASHILKHTREK